jgi:hypothetical protein
VLEEQHDEWQVGRRYFSTESMNKLLQPTSEEVMQASTDTGGVKGLHHEPGLGALGRMGSPRTWCVAITRC